jgi:hypothetical protein
MMTRAITPRIIHPINPSSIVTQSMMIVLKDKVIGNFQKRPGKK